MITIFRTPNNSLSAILTLIVSIIITNVLSQGSEQLRCSDNDPLDPCRCVERGYNQLEIDCSDARTEEEIQQAFSIPLNVTGFWKFRLSDQSKLRRLDNNDFGISTFINVDIQHSDLEFLGSQVFENSYSVLENMDLSDNSIRDYFPYASLEQYSSLESLDLSYNEIPGTMQVIFSSSLKEINLSDNYLTSIWEWTLNYVPALEEISLENNNLARIRTGTFDSLVNLTEINLGRNLLPKINKRTFTNLPKLETLNLSSNVIGDIESGAFSGVDALLELYLDHNSLTTVSSYVRDLPSLEKLYLNNNKITSIESGLFENLKRPDFFLVDISNNQLETIEEDAFKGVVRYLINLDYNKLTSSSIVNGSFPDMDGGSVYLGYNSITTLDESWLRPLFEAGVGVKVDGNPLECGCDMAWIFQFPNGISNFYQWPNCANGTEFQDLDGEYYLNNC